MLYRVDENWMADSLQIFFEKKTIYFWKKITRRQTVERPIGAVERPNGAVERPNRAVDSPPPKNSPK